MVAVVAAALGVWPGLIDKAAALTGIAYAPALLLLIAVVVLLLKILHTDILNTRIERQVKRLNQRLAIYELEQQEYKSAKNLNRVQEDFRATDG